MEKNCCANDKNFMFLPDNEKILYYEIIKIELELEFIDKTILLTGNDCLKCNLPFINTKIQRCGKYFDIKYNCTQPIAINNIYDKDCDSKHKYTNNYIIITKHFIFKLIKINHYKKISFTFNNNKNISIYKYYCRWRRRR